jgi:hypothetical protein
MGTNYRISWLIIYLQIFLVAVVLVLYWLKGFLAEEMAALLAILAPATTLITGIAVKSLIPNKTIEQPPNLLISNKIGYLIIAYYCLIIIPILLKALFSSIDFKDMLTSLSIIESLFGFFIGLFIKQLLEYK